ncbi:MAG: DUF1028 domain-containing protein [Proteobacteria bacterium]|nr:DUF1028 domain-containing protein [Pseudomonadota bacterium]
MTYSIVARCPRTGQYGVGVATYSPMVGAAVPLVVSGRGAVAYQVIASPIHRAMAGQLLASGASAAGSLAELAAKDPYWQSRQVTLVDMFGGVAGFTGANAPAHCGHKLGDGFAVAGNVLTEVCLEDTWREFSATQESDLPLAERLVRALEAGARSNGQPEGLTSAALLVHGSEPVPLVDLRVDVHDTPVKELRRIWEFVRPLQGYYLQRKTDPTGLPRWWQKRMEAVPGWKPNHLVKVVPQQ